MTKLFAVLMTVFLCTSAIAQGSKWERTRRQGVQLARMCINEDSRPLRRSPGGTEGHLTIDCKLIAKVVWVNRFSKSTFESWLDVMKWLSPHVGKLKEAKRHRHAVHANLQSYGDDPPPNWIHCDSDGDCDGDWSIHGPYWVLLRQRVIDYWLSEDFELTGSRPRKWGDSNDVVRFLKNHDHLCVLALGERNFFLARPGEGCELGDLATVAARKGKRFDLQISNEKRTR